MAMVKRATAAFFWQLVENMSSIEFRRLVSSASGEGLTFWDPSTQCKYSPVGLVPWPIIWLTSSHHYKYRHSDAKYPSMQDLGPSLIQWANKLKWRVALTDSSDEEAGESASEQWRFLKSKGKLTQSCPLPQGQLDTLIYDTMQVVSDVCYKSKLLKLRGTRIGLVKLAYNMIREGEHIFIKTDKDGGF